MKRLYRFEVLILDDGSYSDEDMHISVVEALEIHVEALGVKCTPLEITDVIDPFENGGEMPEA